MLPKVHLFRGIPLCYPKCTSLEVYLHATQSIPLWRYISMLPKEYLFRGIPKVYLFGGIPPYYPKCTSLEVNLHATQSVPHWRYTCILRCIFFAINFIQFHLFVNCHSICNENLYRFIHMHINM
jgi:hypothetical protein